MVKLDIFSDPVCPWCYIGKGGLDKALAAIPDHPFTIEWHPYRLNPDLPAGGIARADYLLQKFGSKQAVIDLHLPIIARAEELGLALNLDAVTRAPNTLDAHRLIHWAGIEQRQTLMVDLLFKAYWVEGRDIGNHEVLADIADSAEMDAALVTRLLASDADISDIIARETHSRAMGVTAVPTFIVAGSHAVPGAQTPDVWQQVITEIMAQLPAENAD